MASEEDFEVPNDVGSAAQLSVPGSEVSVGSSVALSRRSSDGLPDVGGAQDAAGRAKSARKSSRNKQISTIILRDADSRARARKAHEPAPFLGINMSAKTTREADASRNNSAHPRKCFNPEEITSEWMVPDNVVINANGIHFVQNAENENMKPRITSSQNLSRMPSRMSQYSTATSEWNSLVPRRHKKSALLPEDLQECIVNTHVKMPFKHALQPVSNNKKRKSRTVSPGADLKLQTMIATVSVAKNLARQQPADEEKKLGKLQKGRLKPLNPVNVQGPTISNCRGIVAERRTNFGPPNPTLERRRQLILNHLQSRDFLYERPLTAESIHQTSIASDLSGNRMQDAEDVGGRSEFDDTEHDEDKLIMNEDYLTSGYTFVTDALDEDGEIDEAVLREALAATSQGTNDMAMKMRKGSSYQRPQTVQDPVPKAVRFADDHEDRSQDNGRRTKSANPRLIDSGRKDKKSMENGEVDSRAIRIPSASLEDIDVTNNVNNNNAQDALRLSYNTILFTSEESGLDKQRTGGAFRPRSKLGWWEDVNKETLAVVVKRESSVDLRVLLTSERNRSLPVPLVNQPRRDRPQSARTAGKAMFDLNKVRQRRPLSAHARSTLQDNNNDLDLSIRPDLSRSFNGNDLENLPNEKAVGHWVSKMRNQRPMSGISLAQAPSEVSSLEVQSDADFQVHGNHMNQSVKTAICTQCHKPSNKIVIHTEDDEVILCDVCDRNNRSKIKKIKKLAVQRDPVLSDEDELEVDEIVTDNVEELENQLQELESKRSARELKLSQQHHRQDAVHNQRYNKRAHNKAQNQGTKAPSANSVIVNVSVKPKSALKKKSSYSSDEVETKHDADIFSRMDQLEATLAAIQQEIQVQMETVKNQEEEEEEEVEDYAEEQNQAEEQCFPIHTNDSSEHGTRNASPESTHSFENDGYYPEKTGFLTQNDSILSVENDMQYSNGEVSLFLSSGKDNVDSCLIKVHQYRLDENKELRNEDTDENGNISTYEMQMISEYSGAHDVNQQKQSSSEEWDNQQLEVVATSKPVVQPRNTNEVEEITASVPPLCFKINAKPPEGHLYYFAYGTDMNVNRFSTYIGRTPAQRLWGLLFGFKLRFNKKGTDKEAGGFPNIEYDSGSSVEGCLYLITEDDLTLLDRCVGYPEHFEKAMLPVWLLNCSNAKEHGVAQYCVPAVVYVAQDSWISAGAETESSYAVDQCLKGGDLLSPSYREFLTKVKRNAENP